MNRCCRSILVILAIAQLQLPSTLAKTEEHNDSFDADEPEWTKKIPEGRYPCIYDAVSPVKEPLHLQRSQEVSVERRMRKHIAPTTEEAVRMIDRIGAKLKQTTVGLQLAKDVSCEVHFRVTKSNHLLHYERRQLSNDKFFNAAVIEAISLVCTLATPSDEDRRTPPIEYHLIFTPNGISSIDPHTERRSFVEQKEPIGVHADGTSPGKSQLVQLGDNRGGYKSEAELSEQQKRDLTTWKTKVYLETQSNVQLICRLTGKSCRYHIEFDAHRDGSITGANVSGSADDLFSKQLQKYLSAHKMKATFPSDVPIESVRISFEVEHTRRYFGDFYPSRKYWPHNTKENDRNTSPLP